MVVRIFSHLFKVIVFAAHPKAFWVSVTRVCFGTEFPKKYSLNWFIPALVNNKLGSFFITIGADGTMLCCFDLKKFRNSCLIALDFI